MSKLTTLFISVCTCLVLQAPVVRAGWFGADFSAEVVQGSAQGQDLRGKMYVGAGRVRTEMKQGDQRLIEIINPNKGQAWMLDDGRKVYEQRSVPRLDAKGGISPNPCDRIAGAECRQLPDEVVNARSTKKWLLKVNGKERLQWNDADYGFPIQIVEAGQIVMSMRYLGEEALQGRRVERWRALQYSGQGVIESEQWYDPQLNIAIRQVAKDGSFRELRNIQLGPQAEALFELPQDYSRLETVPR